MSVFNVVDDLDVDGTKVGSGLLRLESLNERGVNDLWIMLEPQGRIRLEILFTVANPGTLADPFLAWSQLS